GVFCLDATPRLTPWATPYRRSAAGTDGRRFSEKLRQRTTTECCVRERGTSGAAASWTAPALWRFGAAPTAVEDHRTPGRCRADEQPTHEQNPGPRTGQTENLPPRRKSFNSTHTMRNQRPALPMISVATRSPK